MFIQRLLSNFCHCAFVPAAKTAQTQDFPISQSSLESLRKEIRSARNLQPDCEALLTLIQSTIVEARKPNLKCDSIADIHAILSETDAITHIVFLELGQHVSRFRHALRLEYLKYAIGPGTQFNIAKYNLLRSFPGFPGHKQIQHELIRCQIEKSLELDYGLPPNRNTQRFARQNISTVSKARYAQHCLNLFNLSMPISRECAEKMIGLCQTNQLPRQLTPRLQAALQSHAPVHSVIADLLLINTHLHGNHNTHPASRLMEFSTGFVFHPNSTSNIAQLLNHQAPGAFVNVGSLITDKYLMALSTGNTRDFFDNAFAQQDPCFEATIENLIDFEPANTSKQLTAPPIPKWTALADTTQNIEALLEWQEMVNLKNFVDANNLVVMANDYQKIEQLLDCKNFTLFIVRRKTEIFQTLKALIPQGLQHQFRNN